jgi:hypothetical protein
MDLRGTRVDGATVAIVTVGLFTRPALWAIDDVKHERPLGRPPGKQLALGAEQTSESSALSANNFGCAHKDLPTQGV